MDKTISKDAEAARQLATSIRGAYLLSQALYYGIQAMERESGPMRESSNIADMKELREHVFTMFADPAETKRALVDVQQAELAALNKKLFDGEEGGEE